MSKKRNKGRNIFKNRNVSDYRLTHHFFDRWNERISSPNFENKEELSLYISEKYPPKTISWVSGDYYLLEDTIVTCTRDKTDNTLLFVTAYGNIEDNFILYNILIREGSSGVTKIQKRYGKINIH